MGLRMKSEKEIMRNLFELSKLKKEMINHLNDDILTVPGAETINYNLRLQTINTHIGILLWVLEEEK